MKGFILQMKIHFNYIKCGFEVNRLGRKFKKIIIIKTNKNKKTIE